MRNAEYGKSATAILRNGDAEYKTKWLDGTKSLILTLFSCFMLSHHHSAKYPSQIFRIPHTAFYNCPIFT